MEVISSETCEDCGCGNEDGLFYDDDGRYLCPDCILERQCNGDYGDQ